MQRNGLDNTLFVKNITNPETGEQFLGLDYIDMIAVLWKGIQMLDQEIQKIVSVWGNLSGRNADSGAECGSLQL